MLLLCLVIGLILKLTKTAPRGSAEVLTAVILNVCAPALSLLQIHELTIESRLIFPASAAWIAFFLSMAFFKLLEKIFSWERQVTGSLILTVGLSNTAFVGFPFIEALYGSEGVRYALVADQPGTFIVFSTVAVLTAGYYATGKLSFRALGSRIIRFPPFIAFVLALCLKGVEYPASVKIFLEKLASPLMPLALLSVGLQLDLQWSEIRKSIIPLFSGLLYKLLLAPLAVWGFYRIFSDVNWFPNRIAIMEMAMPPMILGSLLATRHGLSPRLSAVLLGAGIPISLVTVYLWYLGLGS